jgi:hypothetical protein
MSSTKSAWDRDWGHSVPLNRNQDRWMLSSMLNLEQLKVAVAAAKRQFGLIRKKYPELKAGLVLSLPGGQTEIDSSPAQILKEFPAMVVDDGNKLNALGVLEHITKMEKSLKNLSSPESDPELKAKAKLSARLEDEFRARFGAKLKAIAAQLNQPVYEAKKYLKRLTDKELAEVADKALMEKMEEIELAEKDFKDLEHQKKEELVALRKQLVQIASRLKFDEKCQVEIRFHEMIRNGKASPNLSHRFAVCTCG